MRINLQKKIPPVMNRGILQVGIIAQRHSRTYNSNATTPKNAKMPKSKISGLTGVSRKKSFVGFGSTSSPNTSDNINHANKHILDV
jgi:hypothetical protein